MLRHIAFLAFLAFGLFSCDSDASAEEVPTAVRTAFDNAYPGAADVEWEQRADGTYDAEFEFNGTEMEVRYTASGELMEIEED